MRYPSDDEVDAVVLEFRSAFSDSMIYGWDEYHRLIPPAWIPIITPRSRANIVHDLSVDHAKRLLYGIPGVRIEERKGLVLFVLRELVVIRIKKLGSDMKSCNIPTQQVIKFLEQEELPAMPAFAVHLQAGYQLNSLQTKINGLFITWPNGEKIRKYWELKKSDDTPIDVIPFPTPEMGGPSERFKPHDTELPKEEKTDEENG